MSESFTAPSIVVAVDGSADGLRAALWAVDEAVSRGIALRLVTVTPGTAEALAETLAAVRVCDRDVTIETAVLAGEPVAALLEESRYASMICLAAGPGAAMVAESALCPVAMIRRPGDPAATWIAADVDGTPGSAAVLQAGVEEARLRHAPLRVLRAGPSDRLVRPHLDERLSQWRQRYPDLDVKPVAVQGSLLSYLERNAARIGLLVVGAGTEVGELLAHPAGFSVLVIDRRRLV